MRVNQIVSMEVDANSRLKEYSKINNKSIAEIVKAALKQTYNI